MKGDDSRKYSQYSRDELSALIESIQAQLDNMDDSTGHLAGPLQIEQAELLEELRRRGSRTQTSDDLCRMEWGRSN